MGDLAYAAGEVVWLLSLGERDAIEEDGAQSALGQLDITGGGGGHRIPTFARWSEVRSARERIIRRKERAEESRRELEALELVARGYTQQEAAAIAGVGSHRTIARRARAGLQELLAELGPDAGEDVFVDRVDRCLLCGSRRRARAPAIVRRIPGSPPVEVRPERPTSVCASCASGEQALSFPPRTGRGTAREVLDYVAWVERCAAVHELRPSVRTLPSLTVRWLKRAPAATARGQADAVAWWNAGAPRSVAA